MDRARAALMWLSSVLCAVAVVWPASADAALSPSGRYLALQAPIGGERIGLVTVDLEKGGAPQKSVHLGNFDVRDFYWVNDERIVFKIVDTTLGGGAQRFGGGLFSVRPDGSELKVLIKHPWANLNVLATAVREALTPHHDLLLVPAGNGDEVIGDPVKDKEALAAVAPVELAARIKAPVLLAYGAKDRRVPLERGDRMRAALRTAGNEPEWVLYPDEGHGWFLLASRVDFANRLERFLARHLEP